MEYKILDKQNIQDYLYSIESIKNYFDSQELEIDEIAGGNINYVFLIKSTIDENKALILKQAVPYLKCLGEDFLLKRERMTYEIRALNKFSQSTKEHIPKIYNTSENMSTVIMQFLNEHIIMRDGLINKENYPNFSEHISTYLSKNLFQTSSLNLNSVKKRELIDNFNSNSELCNISEDFIFTFAFMEHATNDTYSEDHQEFEKLIKDMEFKKELLSLKYKFMTQNDALLHGDLHTGSIMINEKETFIIDPEFAFVGPFGFDIGALIGNLTMSYVSHLVQNPEDKYSKWVLETIKDVLIKFENKFLTLWKEQKESSLITEGFINNQELDLYKQEFMENILKDSMGYAGCKMARRMFGAAGVADIRDISDKAIKDKAIKISLDISKRFVKEHKKISSVKEIINIIKDESKKN